MLVQRSRVLSLTISPRQDFWSVYGRKLGFLTSVNAKDIFIRTSTETRTFQVASGVLVGMDPAMAAKSFPVTTQPSPVSRALAEAFCTLAQLPPCISHADDGHDDRSTLSSQPIPALRQTRSATPTNRYLHGRTI